MHFAGHLAIGYLTAAGPALAKGQRPDLRLALLPAVVGAITPDLINKPLLFFDLIEPDLGPPINLTITDNSDNVRGGSIYTSA